MTCIVALKDPKTSTVIMGGDSRRNFGGLALMLPRTAGKVFEFSGFVIGHTGAGRIRNLTSHLSIKFGEKGPTSVFNLEEELITAIVPAFKALAKKRNALREKEGMVDFEGEILIAFGDQMCLLSNDFCVSPIESPFWSIGSGQRLAIGSLASTERFMKPKERVLEALRVAAEFEAYVGGPFIIKVTKPIPKKRKSRSK